MAGGPARGIPVARAGAWLRAHAVPVFFAVVIVAWAAAVGYRYLDFDPDVIPAGNEFNSVVQTHHLWTRARQCGWCALWDGSERGGFPAFIDLHGSPLHPLVALTTLSLGVVNGAKLTLVLALALAGFAQWWLARELGLGRWAQLWSALMVMVGGHLATRMELGVFSVVLSTATASLLFPATLRLARPGAGGRDVVIYGALLALLAVSGQGYMQVAFLCTLPATLLLLWGSARRLRRGVGSLATAGLLAALLAAPFLVPFLHFWPNFAKDADPAFAAGQPLAYYLLNLVVDEPGFLRSTALQKLPYPYMYALFIGWIPLLLALVALPLARRRDRRPLAYLATSALIVLFVATTTPLRWLQPVLPFLATLRFAPIMGGLAVPPLVALAATGLDRLLAGSWPGVRLALEGTERGDSGWRLSTRWLLLLPMILALAQGFRFTRHWTGTVELPDEVKVVVGALEDNALRWVQTPYGEHAYVEPALRRGLKLSPGIMAWHWRDRAFPQPEVQAVRGPAPPLGQYETTVGGVDLYRIPAQPYATVMGGAQPSECRATGLGGLITVSCQNEEEGALVVAENNAPGWRAWRDGRPVALGNSDWLKVQAPAGSHTFTFRYVPWDVPLGLAFFFFGLAGALALWSGRWRGLAMAGADGQVS